MQKILINKVRCNNCKAEIESMSFHDTKKCICGDITITGGTNALIRKLTENGTYENLSIVEKIRDEE